MFLPPYFFFRSLLACLFGLFVIYLCLSLVFFFPLRFPITHCLESTYIFFFRLLFGSSLFFIFFSSITCLSWFVYCRWLLFNSFDSWADVFWMLVWLPLCKCTLLNTKKKKKKIIKIQRSEDIIQMGALFNRLPVSFFLIIFALLLYDFEYNFYGFKD